MRKSVDTDKEKNKQISDIWNTYIYIVYIKGKQHIYKRVYSNIDEIYTVHLYIISINFSTDM